MNTLSLFPRQWHAPDEAVAFSHQSLEFESALRKKDFTHAESLLNNLVSQTNVDYINRQRARLVSIGSRQNHKKLHVGFHGFWASFCKDNNPLFDLIAQALDPCGYYVHQQNDLALCDVIICSCYSGSPDDIPFGPTRILYLPEPVDPSYFHYDYSISQVKDCLSGRNINIPIYMWELKLPFMRFAYPDRCEQPQSLASVYGPFRNNAPTTARRQVCAIIGNSSPMRLSFINTLREFGLSCDVYGSAFSQTVSCKYDLHNRYMFVLAFESKLQSGYISEKIIHAKCMGSVPIYWGDAEYDPIFNIKAFVSYDPVRPRRTAARIKNLIDSTTEFNLMLSEPLLLRPLGLKALYSNLRDMLSPYIAIKAR
jgi:hypothetical protein